MKAKTIEQDCYGCPSSWSGELEDGRHWRVRYRWGVMRLTVDANPNTMSVFSQTAPEVLEEVEYGDEFDGMCGLDEVIETFGHLIDLGSAEWKRGEEVS